MTGPLTLALTLTITAVAIAAPGMWLSCRRRRVARSWDRHVEDAIRVARPTVEDWSR